MYAIYINANNDTNGNPRRGWLIHESNGAFVGFVDEGYVGRSALRSIAGIVEMHGVVPVTPGFYRSMRKASI